MARFVHIILSALVLASSSGIVLTKHYCRGEFRAQALFVTPESCHTPSSGKSDRPACPFHSNSAEVPADGEKGCCDNRSAVVKSDAPLWHKLPNLFHSLKAPLFPAGYLVLAAYRSFSRIQVTLSFAEWATGLPPPKYGLQVLLQVFRN